MKLSNKIFLPIILISALLILLNGCFLAPSEEQPALTLYTVTYDRNGEDVTGEVPVDATLYKKGGLVTVLGNTGPEPLVNTGYDFYGWNTAADGSGTARPVGYVFAMGETDVTLYAMWDVSPGATGEEDTGGGVYGGGYTPAVVGPCDGNTPPVLTDPDIADMVVAFGCDYTRPLVVLDPEVTAGDQTLTFALIGNPASMSMDYSGAKPAIYWAPVCDDVEHGPFSVILEVSDGCATVEYPFTATATNDLPKLFGANPQAIVDMVVAFGCDYSRALTVLDKDVPGCQTLTFTLVGNPASMSMDYSGAKPAIYWAPVCGDVESSPFSVTLEVFDGCETVSYPFNATATNDEPEIVSLAPITLDFGDTYEYLIEVEDADVPGCQGLAFTLIEPNPSIGDMMIDENGKLTWEPLCEELTWEQVCTEGDCSDQYKAVVHVIIEVYDGCDPVYKEFDITVYSTNRAPNIYRASVPWSACVDEDYCWTIKAHDLDNDNLTWTIVETNASGAYLDDGTGEETKLCWTANCGPIIEEDTEEAENGRFGNPCVYEELCTRYFKVRVYDDGCPKLYDEFCFDVTVRACTLTLNLYQKTYVVTGEWPNVGGGAWGKLIYNPCGYMFDFDFNGHGLVEKTEYKLIYYPDPWPGNGLICLGSGTVDSAGNIHIAESVDTGDLPIPGDENANAGTTTYTWDSSTGAKIFLVLTSDVDCFDQVMVGWTGPLPGNIDGENIYLFEEELITFDDK